MRLAFITPLVDPDDPLLGFIHTWVLRLAARLDHLHVFQLWRSDPPLPPNVTLHSLDRDGRGGKIGALARLITELGPLCWSHQIDGVITHMGPIFAVCVAPLTRTTGIPLALWYAHGHVSPMLRIAHLLVNRAGTSTPEGFRIPSTKLRVTGQGIDTEAFAPRGNRADDLIVSVGRLSPVKHHGVLIDAVHQLRRRGISARLRIVGGATLASERRYADRLQRQIEAAGLTDAVTIVPGIPHHAIAAEYQQAAIFASCSQTGSLDKAVLEAASCGALPITSNPALRPFFGTEWPAHLPTSNSAEAMVDLLQHWLTRSPEQRGERAAVLRSRVIAEHGVDHLADAMIALVQSTPKPPSNQ